jgi:hypothetical protein
MPIVCPGAIVVLFRESPRRRPPADSVVMDFGPAKPGGLLLRVMVKAATPVIATKTIATDTKSTEFTLPPMTRLELIWTLNCPLR